MNVAALIAYLQTQPQDAEVWVMEHEDQVYGYDEYAAIDPTMCGLSGQGKLILSA